MTFLLRALIAVTLVGMVGVGMTPLALAQATGVLHVRMRVTAADGQPIAVPRHVLLVSDNPASRVPWRVTIRSDGTGRVTLPPGNYTIESEEPLVLQGRTFEWRQTLDVTAGTEVSVELTTGNATIGAPPAASAEADTSAGRLDPWDVLLRWQDSVVNLWTPTAPASGVLVSATGLIATNHRVTGTAATVTVQLARDVRIAARVLVSDAERDVAILWADPAALLSRTPVSQACVSTTRLPIERGQAVTAIGTRPVGQPYPAPGTVMRVDTGQFTTDLGVTADGTGGPVFAAGDAFVGLTTAATDTGEARVVRAEAVCEVLAAAQTRMTGGQPPSGTPLRVEGEARAPEDALATMAKRRAGSLLPYLAASDDFDVAFITPVMAYAARQNGTDFGNWTSYVSGLPPVLLVRVTPKQAERFWTTVARGAAMTQGIALPPFKRFKPGFLRMRVTCGGAEVVPIHPLLIERPVSPTDAVREGLYVFAPGDLGPHCGALALDVYSEKAPERRDTVVVDPRLLEQISRDFAEYGKLIK